MEANPSFWSVSYTHLDVYKRQVLFRPVWLLCGICAEMAGHGGVLYREPRRDREDSCSVFTSVSYTHLDVYKRQITALTPTG